MVAPFLAKAFKNPTKGFQSAFFIVWLIRTFVNYCSDNLGLDFNWSYPFGGYLFFFCLGAFVEDSRLNELGTKHLITIGCVSWITNSVITYLGWSKGAFDMSPIFAISAICLYLLLLRVNIDSTPYLGTALSLLSKHSFGINLAHWLAYEFLQPRFVPFLSTSGLLYQAPLSLAVLAAGILLAVVFDGGCVGLSGV